MFIYAPREINGTSRNPDSYKAWLKGVKIVKCDLFIKEDIKKALKDADIAWITNFWVPVNNISFV